MSEPWLERVGAVFEEAGASLWRRRDVSLATAALVAVTMVFPAAVVLALDRAATVTAELRATERLRVFLLDGTGEDDVRDIAAILRASSDLASLERVTSETARLRLLARFPELASATGELGESATLPESLEAQAVGSPVAVEALAKDVALLPGVEEVRYDRARAERLSAIEQGLRLGALACALAGLAAVAAGLANAARIGALSRREQLAVMRLVGAPRAHVLGPFAVEGAVQGALGGLAAAAGLSLLLSFLRHVASRDAAALVDPLSARTWLVLAVAPLAGGAIAGWLASASVLRHHARLER